MRTTPDINATPAAGHWQDFSAPVTLTAEQAAALYRSVNDVATLLSGAIQLAENADSTIEAFHG